jgi:hypothetical protein
MVILVVMAVQFSGSHFVTTADIRTFRWASHVSAVAIVAVIVAIVVAEISLDSLSACV